MAKVVFTGWKDGMQKIALTKLLMSEHLSLSAAKKNTDNLLEGEIITVELDTLEKAVNIYEKAKALGVICEILKNWVDAGEEKMDKWMTIVSITYEVRVNPKTLVCPNCCNHDIHYFYYGEAGGRGGYWVWCSSCLNYMPMSGYSRHTCKNRT